MPTFISLTAYQYAANLFGNGATINSVTMIGQPTQIAMFTDAADQYNAGVFPDSSGLIFSTGIANNIGNGDATNQLLDHAISNGVVDPDLRNLVSPTATIRDAAGMVIEFTAEHTGSYTFPLYFLTEEYPQYVGQNYTDSAAIFLNGTLVPISGTQNGFFTVNGLNPSNVLSNGNTGAAVTYPTDYNAIATGTATINVVQGQNYTLKIVIADFGDSQYNSALVFQANSLFCFARGTMIETPEGPRPIESLRIGDRVLTRDNGLQPIRWLAMSRLSPERLRQNPRLAPITLPAGALGQDPAGRPLPSQDLTVSPQHRILLKSRIAARLLGTDEVLVAALRLEGLNGIHRATDATEQGVDYFHMMFDRHEIVISNGAETESFYSGPEAVKGLEPGAMDELRAVFPQLFSTDGMIIPPQPVRPIPPAPVVRDILERHRRHGRSLIEAGRAL